MELLRSSTAMRLRSAREVKIKPVVVIAPRVKAIVSWMRCDSRCSLWRKLVVDMVGRVMEGGVATMVLRGCWLLHRDEVFQED